MNEANKEHGWFYMPKEWIKKVIKNREIKSVHYGVNEDGKSYLLFKFTDNTETRIDEDNDV